MDIRLQYRAMCQGTLMKFNIKTCATCAPITPGKPMVPCVFNSTTPPADSWGCLDFTEARIGDSQANVRKRVASLLVFLG